MGYTWHAVDLKTGNRGPQLHMESKGRVSRIIGEATDSQNAVLCWDSSRTEKRPRSTNVALGVLPLPVSGSVTVSRNENVAGNVWTRVSTTTAGHGIRTTIPVGVLSSEQPYTVSWLVMNDGASPITLSYDWCDTFSGSVTLQPGEQKRVYVGGARIYDSTYRFADISSSSANRNFLVSEIMVEPGLQENPYWEIVSSPEIPEWRNWTEPGRMMVVLVDPDDRPVWGGVILRRTPNETKWAPVTMATLEHYLDRRYSGPHTFVGTEQATIASTLISAIVATTGVPFTIDAAATGQLRDRTYLDSEDKTTLSLLTDLMNIQNGIEFTVDLEWTDTTNTVLKYVLRIGSRIGKSLPEPTRFEHPGPVQKFTVSEDYTRDNGANDIMAVSSGEGDARPQSLHHVDQARLDAGWVRYERRFTPSTSITNETTLDAYAAEDLSLKSGGLVELSLVADLDSCPRLNVDWWLGDDITAAITAPAYPPRRGADNEMLPGYEETVRVVGWTMDLDARTLTPHLREY